MQSDNFIPDYLRDTYNLLICAFPEGLRDEEYWPLLSILHSTMSFRTIADVLSVIARKDWVEVYNDASGFGVDLALPLEKVDTVKRKLEGCGYEEWLKKT
jgi:hypothetical protein